MPYVSASTSLPRDLDVQINVSRPQAETRTDLSTMCVACEDLGFLPNANRVRFYSTVEAVEADFAAGTDARFAASAFFSQSPRAPQMALGQVFLDNQPAVNVSGVLSAADIAALGLIIDGAMKVTYDFGAGAVVVALADLSFDTVTTIEAIAVILEAALPAELSCTVRTFPGGAKHLQIATVGTGEVTMLYPIAGVAGTDIGPLLKLTAATGGTICNGYAPTGIADELSSIAAAAQAVGKSIYGWALGASLRDVTIQGAAAAWALARIAVMALTSNDLSAIDPTYTTDLASVLSDNKRVFPIYHDNPQSYPDVSILAYMLHVNYRLQDATVTAKFKTLPGIATVVLTETQLAALQAKGYNTYTAIGNASKTFREGVSEESGWYMDTVINLDNFQEDLSVALYNVFLRNKKVSYTRRGQLLFTDACYDIGNQYIYNGTFANREVSDPTRKGGTALVEAVQVIASPISAASAADRSSRVGPPIQMIVQEAGAIHEIAVNVEVVS